MTRLDTKLFYQEYQNFPSQCPKEDQRHKARMAYLEKACTIDSLHLVFASVQEKFNKSIKGYAYLKIPARQFLQSLSEKHRTNPKIYHDSGSKISVNFPVMETDKFQPKFVAQWPKIKKVLTKTSKGLTFAPIESLQMVGKLSGQMTKVGFHFNIVLNPFFTALRVELYVILKKYLESF